MIISHWPSREELCEDKEEVQPNNTWPQCTVPTAQYSTHKIHHEMYTITLEPAPAV